MPVSANDAEFSVLLFSVEQTCTGSLTFVDTPVTGAMISKLQQSILGVVPLSAIRAGKVTAPLRALAIVVFSDRETGSATARD
jgi:hypothetical protein